MVNSSLDNRRCLCDQDRRPHHSHPIPNHLFLLHMAHLHHHIPKVSRDIIDLLRHRLVNRLSLLPSHRHLCLRIQGKHHRTNGTNHHRLSNMASNNTDSSHTNNKTNGDSLSSRNTASLRNNMDSNLTANMFVIPHVTVCCALNHLNFETIQSKLVVMSL